jgi:hypothetical protein
MPSPDLKRAQAVETVLAKDFEEAFKSSFVVPAWRNWQTR